MYKRIFVAVAGDSASHRALREAVDVAADQGAQHQILHVVDVKPHGAPELGVPVRVYEEACRAQGRSVLDARGLARWLLGGIVEGVMRGTPVPVLLVRAL